MRRNKSLLMSVCAALLLIVDHSGASAGDRKHSAEPKDSSIAVTPEQLESALVPITEQIRELHEENERLAQMVSKAEPAELQSESTAKALQTIRIALVAMGIGMIGGLVKLRSVVRKLQN